ncbi:MAG: sigma-70 family RNA polymerase sigma factor [Pirellulaceae bacterium]
MSESSPPPDSLSQGVDATASQPPLEVLWREFGSQLRRRARTRLRQYGLTGQAESMDICNDVMLDLARRQAKDQQVPTALEANDVLGYIMRAIDNQVLDTFRTLARHCRDFRRTEATPVDKMPVAMQATTPSQVALRKEVIARIRTLLGPDDTRIVDLMLENRTWQEIGETIGIQPDTARMRVRRALDRIRAEIGVNDNSDSDDSDSDDQIQGDS